MLNTISDVTNSLKLQMLIILSSLYSAAGLCDAGLPAQPPHSNLSTNKGLSETLEYIEVELGRGEHKEECLHLESQGTLGYQFTATAPLDFNIHYHDDDGETLYPVKEKNVTRVFNTQFDPKEDRVYCLMWSNKSTQNSALRYHFSVSGDSTKSTH